MSTHDQLFQQGRLLHRNLRDTNICYRTIEDEVVGMLVEFANAIDIDDNALEPRSHMTAIRALQSIRSLEDAAAPRSPLDDWESLLYLIIFLGAYGINEEERRAFFVRQQESREPPLAYWITGEVAATIAAHKRKDMHCADAFDEAVSPIMPAGPLYDLAVAIHGVLFCHPGCAGARGRSQALRRARQAFNRDNPGAEFIPPRNLIDPLVLRDEYVEEIVAALLLVLADHR
ncbi:hypothetical protein IWW38_005916, partial [Coemansia aciculifera]